MKDFPKGKRTAIYHRPHWLSEHEGTSVNLNWPLVAKECDRVLAKSGILILWGNQPRLMEYYQDHFSPFFRVHGEIIWAKTAPNLVISWKKPMPQHENAWILVRHKDPLNQLSLQRTAKQRVQGHSLQPTVGGPRQPKDGSYAKTRKKFTGLKRKQVKIPNLDLPLRQGGTGHYLSTVITTRVIRGGHPEYLGHPTQKALDVMKPLISLTTRPGDTILDPFTGSGTTLLAAEMLGRNSLGIELNPKFVQLARERLEAWNGHA